MASLELNLDNLKGQAGKGFEVVNLEVELVDCEETPGRKMSNQLDSKKNDKNRKSKELEEIRNSLNSFVNMPLTAQRRSTKKK